MPEPDISIDLQHKTNHMLLLKYFLFSILFFNTSIHNPKDKTILRPPVKIPVLLSSNFGELRVDHFHSGIDIKTEGVIGKEIVSSADGFIYRISVSPSGFGKALYVRHPSGYSTVYAHLDRFTPEIEEYVKTVQYERKSFLVTLFPPKEKFPVSQGELIALSGNSGSSGGPHLHFEVRESDSELPVNPLLFEIGTSDNILPVIEKLAVYPIGNNTHINSGKAPLRFDTRGSHGKYTLADDKAIMISGSAGFGLKIHDLLNGSSNKCAAYSIEMKIDSVPVFKYEMDGFSFNESRFVNSHIDYESFIKERIYIQRAYVLPNDKLGLYKTLVNRGIYNFIDNKLHRVDITISDASSNKSTLSFNVISIVENPASFSAPANDDLQIMPYSRVNRFVTDDIALSIPSGALYDTLYFSYKKIPGTPVMLSDLHSVHNKMTPLQRAYSLSIKPTAVPSGKESKMLIVQLNSNMSKIPVNSTWTEGFLKSEVLSFGDFFVGIDTISPEIIPQNLVPGANITGRKQLRIKIRDDFSGIKSYEPAIDNKWALFEYDPKNEILIYSFDEKYITKGIRHNFTLKVLDNRDNESLYSCEFVW